MPYAESKSEGKYDDDAKGSSKFLENELLMIVAAQAETKVCYNFTIALKESCDKTLSIAFQT